MSCRTTLLILTTAAFLPVPASPQSTTRLAVMDFSGEGPTEILTTYTRTISENVVLGLSRSRGIRVVERVRIEQALAELNLSSSGAVDNATALRLGRMLGASGIVFGSYSVIGDEIVITTRHVDASTGEVAGSRRVTGRRLLPMVDLLAEQLILDATPLADERAEILQRRAERGSGLKSPALAATMSLVLPIAGHAYIGRASNIVRGIIYTAGTALMAVGINRMSCTPTEGVFDPSVDWVYCDDGGELLLALGAGVNALAAVDALISANSLNRTRAVRITLHHSARSRSVNVAISVPLQF